MSESIERKKPIVLTIAGSDPTGGAGIQADIRAFESMGVHGFSVISAITTQTIDKVISWEPVKGELVKNQLFTLLDNYTVKYVKCGMIPTSEIIDIIVEAKKKFNFTLIVDPILKSGSGMDLTEKDLKPIFIEKLLPITDIIVPNAHEATALTGIEIQNVQDVQEIGKKFESWGIPSMILKGGHIDEKSGQIIDYLYDEGQIEISVRQRVKNATQTHGTGCIFSSIFTSLMALSDDLIGSFQITQDYMEKNFRSLLYLPSSETSPTEEKIKIIDVGLTEEERNVISEVTDIYSYFSSNTLFSKLVPEVKTNISIGLDGAKSKEQVAAIEGRITVVNNHPYACGPIRFGVSNHTARLLMTAQKKDPKIHVVMNLKYSQEMVVALAEEGFYLFEINRKDEITPVENNTMQWVINESYKVADRIPDIVWDKGEMGKEPMLRVFAQDGAEMIKKLEKFLLILNRLLEK